MTRNASYWIQTLELAKHPEGGYYKEVYRSPSGVQRSGSRETLRSCTHIHYLLEGGDFSAFHRLQSDELWHFHAGGSLKLISLTEEQRLREFFLGPDPEKGEQWSLAIPKNTWFAASCVESSGFSLVGCTVAPGFEFSDFEMANREELLKKFPKHKEEVLQYTR